MSKAKVRTRIAPSPTGIPHIGNTRTALFDYLLAKKYDGDFILRIEDTDQKRLVPEALEATYEILDFLDLQPDESPKKPGKYGPYVQTERLDIYQKYAQELIDKGFAYKDDGAIRIKMPKEGYASWKDLVQKKISFPYNEVDDKVLLKSDGVPTYHLAAMVDDHLMEISHILRGVEWISSTPVHLVIYQALGWQIPILAHVPLLLGPDKSKLSKRHGAKSILGLRDDGYLPEALNNFMFYLGFSYQDNSKLLTLKEMIGIFDESKLQKQNAIYDVQKLNYFNSHWIKRLEDEDIFDRLLKFGFIPKKWLGDEDKLRKIVSLVKERMHTLKDFAKLAECFFEYKLPQVKEITDQTEADVAATRDWLSQASQVMEKLSDFTGEKIHTALGELQKNSAFTPRQAFMSLRVAGTASTITPPLFDTFAVIGKQEIIKRLKQIDELLK